MKKKRVAKDSHDVLIGMTVRDYGGFHDPEWARMHFDTLASLPALHDAFVDLCFSWDGLSSMQAMPALVPVFHGQFVKHLNSERNRWRTQFLEVLRHNLVAEFQAAGRLPDVDIVNGVFSTARMQTLLLDAAGDMGITEDSWKEYIAQPRFRVHIVPLLQQIYAGLVFSYEDFLVRCLGIVSPSRGQRRTGKGDFSLILTEVFKDESLTDYCWGAPDIKVAKLIRHAIAHNGARLTPELKDHATSLPMASGQIQPTAAYTSGLHAILKVRVDRLIHETVTRIRDRQSDNRGA